MQMNKGLAIVNVFRANVQYSAFLLRYVIKLMRFFRFSNFRFMTMLISFHLFRSVRYKCQTHLSFFEVLHMLNFFLSYKKLSWCLKSKAAFNLRTLYSEGCILAFYPFFILNASPIAIFGTKYSRVDQVKFVEGSL